MCGDLASLGSSPRDNRSPGWGRSEGPAGKQPLQTADLVVIESHTFSDTEDNFPSILSFWLQTDRGIVFPSASATPGTMALFACVHRPFSPVWGVGTLCPPHGRDLCLGRGTWLRLPHQHLPGPVNTKKPQQVRLRVAGDLQETLLITVSHPQSSL